MRVLQDREHEDVTTQKGMRVLQHREQEGGTTQSAWGCYNTWVHLGDQNDRDQNDRGQIGRRPNDGDQKSETKWRAPH